MHRLWEWGAYSMRGLGHRRFFADLSSRVGWFHGPPPDPFLLLACRTASSAPLYKRCPEPELLARRGDSVPYIVRASRTTWRLWLRSRDRHLNEYLESSGPGSSGAQNLFCGDVLSSGPLSGARRDRDQGLGP